MSDQLLAYCELLDGQWVEKKDRLMDGQTDRH